MFVYKFIAMIIEQTIKNKTSTQQSDDKAENISSIFNATFKHQQPLCKEKHDQKVLHQTEKIRKAILLLFNSNWSVEN